MATSHSEFGANFSEYFLKTGLFGLEAALQRPAAELEGSAGSIGVGFTTRHQVSELAF
jgi:hypothetical protein